MNNSNHLISDSNIHIYENINICNNETINDGFCFGLAICGYCYDLNETVKSNRTYEIFNLVSSFLIYYFLYIYVYFLIFINKVKSMI